MRYIHLNWIFILSLLFGCNSVSDNAKFHAVFEGVVINKTIQSKDSLLSEMERLPWDKVTEAGIIIDAENFLKFDFIRNDDKRNLYFLTHKKEGSELSIEYFASEEVIISDLLVYFERHEKYKIVY